MWVGRIHSIFAGIGLVCVALLPACTQTPSCVAPSTNDSQGFSARLGLDSSFGTGGASFASFSDATYATDVLIAADESLLAAGKIDKRLALAKFKKTGELNTSFGTNGTSEIPVEFSINKLVIQGDGATIVAAVDTSAYIPRLMARRILPDGSIDLSFANGGLIALTLDSSATYTLQAVSLMPDNKILFVASAHTTTIFTYPGINFALPITYTSAISIYRTNPDGSPDLTFGNSGLANIQNFENLSLLNSIDAVAANSDDAIYLAGDAFNSVNPGEHLAVTRLLSNGNFDYYFGTGGVALQPLGIAHGEALSLQLLNDGKILSTGRATIGNETDILITRFNSDGSTDQTFNNTGLIRNGAPNQAITGTSIIEDPTGNILVGGYKTANQNVAGVDSTQCSLTTNSVPRTSFYVTRYLPNGLLDKSFSDNGTMISDFDANQALAYRIKFDSHGKLIAGGGADATFAIVRILP